MRNRVLRSTMLAAGGLICAAVLPSAASATYLDTTVSGGSVGMGSLGGINGNVTFVNQSNKTVTETAAIGQIALKGKLSTTSGTALTTLKVFCIDVYDWLGNGKFTQTDISAITSPNQLGSAPNTVISYSAAQLDSVLKLLVYTTTGSTPIMNDAVTSAATQMAIWEILSETTSSWDLGVGTFKVGAYNGNSSQMSTAIADANSWLNTVKTGSINTNGYSLSVWDPGVSNQRQVQLVSSGTPAVPEPATWATIVLGFGVLGSTLRTRKRAVAFAL